MPLSLDQLARLQIKRWMESMGVKQGELAQRVGKNQAWMSRYLGEKFEADIDTLHKMAQVFGHTLVQLLELPGDPHERTLIASYRALRPEARELLLKVVADWTRAPGPARALRRAPTRVDRATANETRRGTSDPQTD